MASIVRWAGWMVRDVDRRESRRWRHGEVSQAVIAWFGDVELDPVDEGVVVDRPGVCGSQGVSDQRCNGDRIFALFFEANGLAVAGREPYRTLIPSLVDIWIDWAAQFIPATTTIDESKQKPPSHCSTDSSSSANSAARTQQNAPPDESASSDRPTPPRLPGRSQTHHHGQQGILRSAVCRRRSRRRRSDRTPRLQARQSWSTLVRAGTFTAVSEMAVRCQSGRGDRLVSTHCRRIVVDGGSERQIPCSPT